jgi:very-short-patch-repair endonuclease
MIMTLLTINFEKEYAAFMQKHHKIRKGERARRLLEGHRHAEKLFLEQVWWPAFGHFENLHPEYEVSDFRDGNRYIDFAYIKHSLRVAIEIDGFGPHAAQISRNQFSDHRIRQNHLTIDGWRILRFSYDDVSDKPRMCEQMLQQFMGRWSFVVNERNPQMNYIETGEANNALSRYQREPTLALLRL